MPQRATFVLVVAIAIVMMAMALRPGRLFAAASAQPPPDYYTPAEGLTGDELRDALHGIIAGHTRLRYDDLWPLMAHAASFDTSPGFLRTVYKNALVSAEARPADWNREHSWPTSYGFPNDNRCNYPYTDAHHIFPANPSYNSSRGNGIFDFCMIPGATCVARTVDEHPATPNLRRVGTGEWEVWPGRRGDIARALLYMDLRYAGGAHGIPVCAAEGLEDADLTLTDDIALIVTSTTTPAFMGNLCALLEWHLEDPVDPREEWRNDRIFERQDNRNPFVDRPQWVLELWEPCDIGGDVPTPGSPATIVATATSGPTETPGLTATPRPTETPAPFTMAFLPWAGKDHLLPGFEPPPATATASPLR